MRPDARLAFSCAARRRADLAHASQLGEGPLCFPLCVGLAARIPPRPVPKFFDTGLAILLGAALVHVLGVLFADGLPRWMGGPLVAASAWLVAAGLRG